MTFDVVNFHTNIPHTYGLETLDYWLENHPESLHVRFNREFVLECATFILQNSNMKRYNFRSNLCNCIDFIDIIIKRNENGIWMDLYHKPTGIQRCLPFTSSHPNHCKRNIPFRFARRICTITENNAEKLKNLENLKSNLSKCHYLDSRIQQGFKKALSIPQKRLTKT